MRSPCNHCGQDWNSSGLALSQLVRFLYAENVIASAALRRTGAVMSCGVSNMCSSNMRECRRLSLRKVD